jgi:hypothetical protein
MLTSLEVPSGTRSPRQLTLREALASPAACTAAARRGSLRMLKYLRQKGFAWDGMVVQMALRYNHMELVNWAVAEGAPLDRYSRRHFRRQRSLS